MSKTKNGMAQAKAQTRQNPNMGGSEKRRRAKKDQAVYFKCRAGNFVLESADYRHITMGNGTSVREKMPDTIIWFTNGQGYHVGYSRGYDPTNPDDARVIALARKAIAEGKDERVRINGFCEEDPFAPRAPVPNWDNIAPHRLVDYVRDLGLNLDQCIEYEEYYGSRPDVVDGLIALRDEKVPEDPLTVPSL